MNTSEQNLRKFRYVLTSVAILTGLIFSASTVVSTFYGNDSGSLASSNLNGIARMVPAIMPSILVGIATLFVSMYSIGKLLGQNWRTNLKAMLDKNNNDSTFVLSEKIAFAATFAALAVPMISNSFVWILILTAKLVVLLAISIVITAILSAFLIWGSQDPNYKWWQVDRWWIDNMAAEGNDMVARLTGLVFQITGIAMLGVLLVAQL